MKYVILYGSESSLIRNLFESEVGPITKIRIYGSNKPEDHGSDVLIDGRSESSYQEVAGLLSGAKRGDKIVFVGAAFRSDNDLLVNQSESEIAGLVQLNIMSYVRFVHAILPIMVRIRSGNFIYLSSFRSKTPTRGAVIYSASKAFGESFFSGIAREYGRFGVFCNSLRMGYFDGRILSSLGGEDAVKKVTMRSPLRRLGTSEDISIAIDFCLRGNFTTGGVIDLDGAIDFE